MTQVLDYSAGFPGAQAIQAAGYDGAVRYIGYPGRPKCATAEELADFTAHGLGMALVFENTIGDWRGGANAGQLFGAVARKHANSIGFPADRPIYMAIDQDVVTSGEFTVMLDYLRGAGTSLGGPQLTGVYGEADVIDRARGAGVTAWYWQTVAWSHGRRTTAHLFQQLGTVYVGGVACDINDVLAPDWGQHTEEAMPTIDEFVAAMKFKVLAADDFRFDGRNLVDLERENLNAAQRIEIKLDAVAGALSDNEAHILAAVRAQPSGGQVDVADLSTRLTTTLGPALAAELGRRLSTQV